MGFNSAFKGLRIGHCFEISLHNDHKNKVPKDRRKITWSCVYENYEYFKVWAYYSSRTVVFKILNKLLRANLYCVLMTDLTVPNLPEAQHCGTDQIKFAKCSLERKSS